MIEKVELVEVESDESPFYRVNLFVGTDDYRMVLALKRLHVQLMEQANDRFGDPDKPDEEEAIH